MLALDVHAEPTRDVDDLVDHTACVVHTTLEQLPKMQERFAVGVAHLHGDVKSLRPVVDALRAALVPDGVAVVVCDPSAVSPDVLIDVVSAVQESFVICYVLADRTLWLSQAAPSLPELTEVEGRLFMALASDAAWRLQAATRTGTPAEELKPIFRLVKEQAIHLDSQRSLLADLEHDLGVQLQQLDRAAISTRELQAELTEARVGRKAAEDANVALAAEVELWKERYSSVVDSPTWKAMEHLRKFVRPLRRSAR